MTWTSMGTTNCCLCRKDLLLHIIDFCYANCWTITTSWSPRCGGSSRRWKSDRLNPEGLRRRLTKRLEGLGFKVTLEAVAQVA